MLKVAVLDDYQNVFSQIINLDEYKSKYEFTIFNEPFQNELETIEALKDFEVRGFIKVKKEGIEILDKEGLMKYYKDFGKAPDHYPKVEDDEV